MSYEVVISMGNQMLMGEIRKMNRKISRNFAQWEGVSFLMT